MDRNEKRKPEDRKENQQDQDLPGYPHYPADEDIMNPQHGFKKIAADEELANSTRLSGKAISEKRNPEDTVEPADDEDDLQIVSGTEADVTDEDLIILGDKDADQDLGDDEMIGNARVDAVDEEDDLDVPGSDMNDEESLGQGDEENNYYSLGGDRHENLDEDSSNFKE